MFNIPAVSILVFPLLVFGPLFPVLPVATSITMRLAIGIAIFSMVLAWKCRRVGVEKLLISIGVFALLICAVPMIVKGYDSFLLTIILGGFLGFVAFWYFKSPMPILGVFVLLCLYLVLYYLRIGNLDEAFSREIGEETAGASRNFVGVVLLQYYLIYYAVCIANRLKPAHWPLFVMPVIAIMSSGVGSTVVATALLIGYMLIKLRVKLAHGILGLIFIALVGIVASRWIETTLLFERLMSGDFVLSRIMLWSDFFDKLTPQSVIVGFTKDVGFVDHPLVFNNMHNLHNSYLNLYKMVGIFSCLYFILVIYVASAIYKVNKVLFIIYLGSLFRAATDGYYFSSFLVDFIIFYLFLLTPLGARLVRGARRLGQGTRKHEYVSTLQ